ncbi:hypothetical protein ACIQB5_42450 [Streptomyces sp. NPDC088560]|uniref:hypothetical protein n=1 Tax=Streptomyces sp. NPDC088560 TaxID=3365868 RepID=UPI0038023703
MLLRLAYLGVTNAFAMLRLLPMSDRDKDVEILVLRHQIAMLERQLGGLLDRTLIWNQRHLLNVLREFEQFYNGHRPQQGIANARPLYPLPAPIAGPDQIARLDIRRRDGLGGILHEYEHAA